MIENVCLQRFATALLTHVPFQEPHPRSRPLVSVFGLSVLAFCTALDDFFKSLIDASL